MKKDDNPKRFRPEARHLLTIGKELIKDQQSAILELVKNAYDADADDVYIIFKDLNDKIQIIIKDNGHGMTENDIESKWLVPSTSDKQNRKTSPKGRKMQGRKGIGRFATSMLGEKLELITVKNNIETSMMLNWADFTKHKYLDEIKIYLSTYMVDEDNGTKFIVTGDINHKNEWNTSEFKNLNYELRKLVTPLVDKFNIYLDISDFRDSYESLNISKDHPIERLTLFEEYHYRIHGTINDDGSGKLTFEHPVSNFSEDIDFNVIKKKEEMDIYEPCGKLIVDFRVFDRDKSQLENLAKTLGLFMKNNKPDYRGAAKVIDNIIGVNISRFGFRLRPYGEEFYDWLGLDTKRVQNPTLKIGVNQISGSIEIESEEQSNLIDKSARDGLKENKSYNTLKLIVNQIIQLLETRRYGIRRKSTTNFTHKLLTTKMIRELVDYSSIKSTLELKFSEYNVKPSDIEVINQIIDEKTKTDTEILNQLENTLAEYQNQVTLGRMINVLLHEISRPLGTLKDNSKMINEYYELYNKQKNIEYINEIITSINNINEQSEFIIDIVQRLKPFSIKKSTLKRSFSVVDLIKKSLNLYKNEFKRLGIEYQTNFESNSKVFGWHYDFSMVINNIIDNAVFWLSTSKNKKKLFISVNDEDDYIKIEFINNGPKIPEQLLKEGLLFVPGISNKPDGTGLGLSIVGEATQRLDGNVTATNLNDSVVFTVMIPHEGDKKNV